MTSKTKGYICGIIAAITYGMNPLGALSLYSEGINTDTVIFFRYGIAAFILAIIMLIQRTSLRVTLKELSILAVLGVLFAISSLSLFGSFHHMDAGIASTILFVYPVMVAVIMAAFFKERLTVVTILSITLALCGIGLLYQGGDGGALSTIGILLVMLSSLMYAIYMVIVNQSPLQMPAVKLTFYVMLFSILTVVIHSFTGEGNHLQMLTTPFMWGWALMLAVVPTIISLVLMVVAIKAIGSTPTAIMGALEPLTAVVIGITVFHEAFTFRLAIGILLILAAVMLIIVGKSLKVHLLFTRQKQIQ